LRSQTGKLDGKGSLLRQGGGYIQLVRAVLARAGVPHAEPADQGVADDERHEQHGAHALRNQGVALVQPGVRPNVPHVHGAPGPPQLVPEREFAGGNREDQIGRRSLAWDDLAIAKDQMHGERILRRIVEKQQNPGRPKLLRNGVERIGQKVVGHGGLGERAHGVGHHGKLAGAGDRGTPAPDRPHSPRAAQCRQPGGNERTEAPVASGILREPVLH